MFYFAYRKAKDSCNPYQYKNSQSKCKNVKNRTKIIAVRDPLSRLYSALKDKSRTFRFENGTVDWEKAATETTWGWGTDNWTKKEKSKLLHERVQSHDREFDPTIYGIDKFEARVLQRWISAFQQGSKTHEGIISASLIFEPLNRH